ncbi:MAG: putative repeat protein (TIGR01451 family) [Saprospiraceae bacterium]|jgi:uncharacterized repeat protein (TIGR01451 family)
MKDNKRLKELSDKYEVDFDPAAWDKMEKLLPEATSPRMPFFKRLRFIAAAILLLLVFVGGLFVVSQEKVDSVVIVGNDVEEVVDSQDIKEDIVSEENAAESPPDPSADTEQALKEEVRQVPNEKNINNDNSDTKQNTNISEPKTSQSHNPKTPFFQKIAETLDVWRTQTSPEKTYLHTDRAFYKPGESIWFAVYVRNADDLKASRKSDIVRVEWIAPNGKTEKTLTLVTKNGVVAGDILMTKEMVGGTYKLKAYTNWQKNSETYFEKEIQVQKTVLPRLRMELDFERETYGAGDEVIAKLDLNTLENSALKNYDFSYVFSLNGGQISEENGKTDAAGHAELKLQLPISLDTNDGLLNILINYNGQTESISRAVPIVLHEIDLQFFPEGGQNIANTASKMAFKAINEFGEPTDIEGLVLNESGETVTTFKSYHQGMGAFTWTPEMEGNYTAKITKPKGLQQVFALPKAEKRGYSLSIREVTNNAIIAEVSTTENEKLHIIAQARDQAIFHVDTPEESGTHIVSIPTKDLPIGITQLTLFDSREVARAERLVFVNSDKKLTIKVSTDKEKYQPREKVKMTVDVRDERGIPMPGTFSVAVADDNLLTYADDKQGHILSQILLQSDLKGEIKEPNFYFDTPKVGETKDKTLALDYLLMTQGWRRYEWLDARELPVVDVRFENEKAEIGGIVVDEMNRPLANYQVILANPAMETFTDDEGKFLFQKVGYIPNRRYSLVGDKFRIYSTLGTMNNKIMVLSPGYGVIDNPKISSKSNNNVTAFSGKVVDGYSNEPILFGDILLYRNSALITGTNTDFEGEFKIDSIASEIYNVTFKYVGYEDLRFKNVKIKAGHNNILDVKMHQSGVTLAEVAVIAYKVPLVEQDNTTQGVEILSPMAKVQQQDEITEVILNKERGQYYLREKIIRNIESGNVSLPLRSQTINPPVANVLPQGNIGFSKEIVADMEIEHFEKKFRRQKDELAVKNENMQDVLAGKVAGMDINKNAQDIRVRGLKAIDGSQKLLFVIDGIRMQANAVKGYGDLLDPENIENVEVVVGEAAVSIYGTPAKSGAVIIKTKTAGLSEVEKQSLLKEKIYSFENFIEELQERAARGENIASDNSSFSQMNHGFYHLYYQCEEEEVKDLLPEMGRLGRVGSNLFESQRYARAFKNGYYRARKFYTPKYNSIREVENRTDFRSTIYWNPTLEVKNNGKAEVEFYNSDEITTFKAIVEGIAVNGSIGRGEATFYSILPFGMTTKIPTNVLIGDELNLPLTLMNNTAETMTGFFTVIAPQGFEMTQKIPSVVTLYAGERKTISLPYKVMNYAKDGTFKIFFEANNLKDAFEQNITVLQRGFPVNEVVSGKAQRNKFNISINKLVDKSLTAKLTVYPNLEEDIIKTTERMLRQPSGCFEQTSSSNYPNLLVLDLLKSTGRLRPNIQTKAQGYLDKGYKRLIGFEVEGGGFDWYGKPPAHEALTAYGLMQFVDMKSVYSVDNQLINRTADWLLSRRNGKGGWQNSKRALHSWALQTPVGDAYIVWAMSEAGYGNEISTELEKSYQDAIEIQDPYIMALVVLALQNVEDSRAEGLLEVLSNLENKEGFWTGLTHSMTHSKGKGLAIETTALTALAMLRTDKYEGEIERAINYISSSKNEYGFGSTQSTVLALKALTEYTRKSPIADETGGEVTLLIDGKKVKKQSYFNGSTSAIIFDDLAGYFTEGNHIVDVKFSSVEAVLPFDFSVKYATTLPPSSPKCAVELTTKLNTAEVSVGETVRYIAEIQNVTNEDVANPIAVIGIPAGLTLQPWQLKKLEEQNLCDYYELKGNYLVLYYRGLTAGEKRTINLDLKADIAGSFVAPASVAYLYYENEHRNWVRSAEIRVNP